VSLTPDSFSSDVPEEEHIGAGEAKSASSQPAAEPGPVEHIEGTPTPVLRTPVEAEYETNGGPLGCCLGTVVGVLLTALLITLLSISFSNGAILGPVTLPVVLAGAALCGYFGWRIGKRVYREYELSPRQQRKLAQLEKKYGPERAQR
jgi:hypothetical protein